MAKKTVFQNIEIADVTNLEIEDSIYCGVYASSSLDEIATVLLIENQEKYIEIESLLKTETTNDLTILKKGFALPGNTASADRIKEACKEHKLSITNDYEEADFIITHDNVSAEIHGNEDVYPTNSMLLEFRNGYFINGGIIEISNYNNNTGYSILYDKRIQIPLHRFDYQSAPYNSYILPGLSISIASKIKSKTMQVVDVETILNSSANIQTLNDEKFEQIINMLNGSWEDKELLAAIIPTIDYRKTPALLWQLAVKLRHKAHYWSRNKDVKYWFNVANIDNLGYYNAEEAILHFDETNQLDSENFKILEPLCRKEIDISNRALYVFKVGLNSKWKKYLTTNK